MDRFKSKPWTRSSVHSFENSKDDDISILNLRSAAHTPARQQKRRILIQDSSDDELNAPILPPRKRRKIDDEIDVIPESDLDENDYFSDQNSNSNNGKAKKILMNVPQSEQFKESSIN